MSECELSEQGVYLLCRVQRIPPEMLITMFAERISYNAERHARVHGILMGIELFLKTLKKVSLHQSARY